MDHLHFVDIKTSIDRKETASIKEAIFKRAREKAQALSEEKQEKYTSQVQKDIMEIARGSITASPMNPFNQFMNNVGTGVNEVKKAETPKQEELKDNFPDLNEVFSKEVKHNIESVKNENFANTVKEETMAAARDQFRTNLNATLNFLNSKAAIKAAEYAHSKINYT